MIPILIDCDPGHDDMVAILLAWATEEIELLGITTVAGNQTVDKTFLNARKIATLIKADTLPVLRGSDAPLLRPLVTAAYIHGKSGLDGAALPTPSTPPATQHAVDFIIEQLRNAKQPITLVPTGPLTNIALALRLAPDITSAIARIVLMGGAVHDANVTPVAEFNIYVDPDAAAVVFDSGLPITMVGLDVTNRALLTFDDFTTLEKMNGPISRIVAALLRFYAGTVKKHNRIKGATLHDALAVAAAFRPEIVQTRHLNVTIETASDLCRGQTVTDLNQSTKRTPNADVALELDVADFHQMIMSAIERLDRQVG